MSPHDDFVFGAESLTPKLGPLSEIKLAIEHSLVVEASLNAPVSSPKCFFAPVSIHTVGAATMVRGYWLPDRSALPNLKSEYPVDVAMDEFADVVLTATKFR